MEHVLRVNLAWMLSVLTGRRTSDGDLYGSGCLTGDLQKLVLTQKDFSPARNKRIKENIMPPNHSIIEGPYLHDILDQPRALRETVTGLTDSRKLNDHTKGLYPESYQQIVLTGMGGSYLILYPLYLTLIELGFPVRMVEASELIHFMPRLLGSRTLLIVASQSGRSGEIVRLLNRNGERPTILGITNDASSPLAKEADFVALIKAGAEASGACKTTTATLAALSWIGDFVSTRDLHSTRDLLQGAAPAVEQYLKHWGDYVEALCAELRGIRHLFITGRGPSLPAAGIGGMLMKETAHFHSEGLGSAAFRHGPFEMLNEDCFVLVFAGDEAVEPLNRTLVEDVRRTGARAELIGPAAEFPMFRLPQVHKQIRPIVEMIPLQMVSLALAALAGREAGKFERIAKVTTDE
jgi:glucosamine--fructose-6-phosphate aminotransferase (isomerizing)